jgi:hypothetical protein
MAEVPNFPSNSNKSKQQQSLPTPQVTSKVSGGVQMEQNKKDKFMAAMFAKDIIGGLKNLFWQRVVPRTKAAFMTNIHDAVNTIFGWSGGNGTPGQVNYSNMYQYNTSYPGQAVTANNNKNYQQITGYPKASDLVFTNQDPEMAHTEALNTLAFLKAQIEDRGFVSVNTLYGYLGRSIDSVWVNYGWLNVDNASLIQQGNAWILKLPKASPINNV